MGLYRILLEASLLGCIEGILTTAYMISPFDFKGVLHLAGRFMLAGLPCLVDGNVGYVRHVLLDELQE